MSLAEGLSNYRPTRREVLQLALTTLVNPNIELLTAKPETLTIAQMVRLLNDKGIPLGTPVKLTKDSTSDHMQNITTEADYHPDQSTSLTYRDRPLPQIFDGSQPEPKTAPMYYDQIKEHYTDNSTGVQIEGSAEIPFFVETNSPVIEAIANDLSTGVSSTTTLSRLTFQVIELHTMDGVAVANQQYALQAMSYDKGSS